MVAYIILAFLLILVTLLFIPLEFYGHGHLAESDSTADIGITWACGLVVGHWHFASFESSQSTMRMGPWPINNNKHITKSKPPKSTDKAKTKRSDWNFVRDCMDTQVFREIFRCLSRLWQSLHLRGELAGEYSTDDPAITGYIAALISVIRINNLKLLLTPQFAETSLNLKGHLQGRLIPGLIILELANLMLKKPIRLIWLTRLRNRHNKK